MGTPDQSCFQEWARGVGILCKTRLRASPAPPGMFPLCPKRNLKRALGVTPSTCLPCKAMVSDGSYFELRLY